MGRRWTAEELYERMMRDRGEVEPPPGKVDGVVCYVCGLPIAPGSPRALASVHDKVFSCHLTCKEKAQ